MKHRPHEGTALRSIVAVVAAALSLTACGSAATSSAPAATSTHPTRSHRVTGLIASVSGNTLELQGKKAKAAVDFTSSTSFTQSVAATAKDVAVGSCAVVRSSQPASSPPASTAAVTATSVQLSSPVNGQCGPGGGGKHSAGRKSTARPRGAGHGARGLIVAVSGSTFTLRRGGASSTATRTVTTTAATTYVSITKATSAAAVPGRCATARGTRDTAGTLTASAIAIGPAVAGACHGVAGA